MSNQGGGRITGPTVIPAEAVEAALLAMRGLNFYDYNDAGYIRAALEAAAPHMLAEAWDEAMKRATEVAWEHDASASSAVSQIPNPYMPAQEATK